MLVSKTVALFFLLGLSFSAAEVKPTLNKRESGENLLDIDLGDNLFARIKCQNTTKPSKSTQCQVHQEPLDEKYNATTCEVELDNQVGEDDVLLYNFGINKVVIVWWSESDNVKSHRFIRHSIVHLADCKVFEANVNLTNRDFSAESWNDLRSGFLDRGNGFFDVFYYAEKANNKIEDISRVSFDSQGNTVAQPVDSFDITEDFQKLAVSPTSKKDLHMAILTYSNDTYEFSLFADDGSWKVIKTSGEVYQSFSMSGDYDAIRWCSLKRKRSKIFCKVFNLKDNSTSSSRFDVVDVDDFEIQNLADNKFLLLTTSSTKFHVMKYGADEKQYGKIEFPPLQCSDGDEDGTHLYVKGNEYCAAQICGDDKEYNIINYCFNDQDFK